MKLAGLIYIKELDWDKKQGEFAYCIGYEYGNKGLISQSIKALSKLAFKNLGIETLQIIAHKTNVASVKVAEKKGIDLIPSNFKKNKELNNSKMD